MMLYSLAFAYLIIVPAQAIIGYDCGTTVMNITTISLLDVGECDFPRLHPTSSIVDLQLLQINDFLETKAIQCKIEIRRNIFYCGMHSHSSVVANGYAEYLYDVSRETCLQLQETGIINFDHNHVISGVRRNQTSIYPITYAGSVGNDGTCTGTSYSDPYGTWDSVIVQGTLKITLTQQTARVSLADDKIHFNSGTSCLLSKKFCIDTEGGYTFWDSIPDDNCGFNNYGVLFEGPALKIMNPQTDQDIVYSFSDKKLTFALSKLSEEQICGYKLTRTEHPKLVIVEISNGRTFAKKKELSSSNLDIFAYVNAKFVYMEKYAKKQMISLYHNIVIERCRIEQMTLRNALAIATQSPDQFAYNLMKGPGYMAVMAGEVIHLVKCIPVEVTIDHEENCYAELRVLRQNTTLFLTPRTHILKLRGTRIPCNKILPSYYRVDSDWYKMVPKPTEAKEPTQLKPMTKLTWKYVNPTNLATAGIYSSQDLEKLKDRIMFPIETTALINNVAHEMHQSGVTNGNTLSHFINEDSIDKLVDSAWSSIWNKFITFGSISAGVIAILLIIHLIKSLIGIILNGYALHRIYGWSLHLLAAVWSTATHFFISLNRPAEREEEPKSYELIVQNSQPEPVEEDPDPITPDKKSFFTAKD